MHLPSPAWRGQRNLLSHNRSSSRIEWGSRLFSVIYLGQCFEKGTRIATAPGHFGYPGSPFPEYAVWPRHSPVCSVRCRVSCTGPGDGGVALIHWALPAPPPIDLRVRQHVHCMLSGFYAWCQAGYSSVCRASDCKACRDQMIPGLIPGGRICLTPYVDQCFEIFN